MFKYKVSICMPTYNQPDFLGFVLDYVVIQDFKDYEVIISDDSTNDDSRILVEKYRSKIPHLTYVKNTPSKKSPGSWNEAIKHAQGEYIKVLHSDDWFPDSTSLRKYVQMLDANPKSDFAFSAAYVCNEEKRVKFVHTATPSELRGLKKSPTYLFGRNIVGAPSATIYRSSVVNKYFDEKMKWVVDLDQYISILGENINFQYSIEPLICTTDGAAHQSIHGSVGLKNVELYEWLVLYTKLRKKYKPLKYRSFMWLYIMFVLERCHISKPSQVEDVKMEPEERKLVKNLLKLRPLFFIFKVRKYIFRETGPKLKELYKKANNSFLSIFKKIEKEAVYGDSVKDSRRRVLITGVAGLLGSHFSKYLLDKGYDVIGIDNLSGGYLDYIDKRLIESGKNYEVDLTDAKALEKVFIKHRPEYVYHFAAYAAEGLSPFIRNFNYTNNLLCSVNVINNCIKYNAEKIIFTSSMAVYGHGNPPFREDQTPNPADPYGIAKYAVEMDLKQAYEQFGLKYSIARPHNVIGINQNIWDKYRNVIGIWIRQILIGEPMLIYGDGKQKRAFSDIKFYMEPFEKLMDNFNGEVFNIGADHEYDLNTISLLLQKIGKEFKYNPTIKHVEERLEVKNAYCDHSKAKKMLGFVDNTNIEATIREMFMWGQKQPKREVKYMNYEIDKNIYSFWK